MCSEKDTDKAIVIGEFAKVKTLSNTISTLKTRIRKLRNEEPSYIPSLASYDEYEYVEQKVSDAQVRTVESILNETVQEKIKQGKYAKLLRHKFRDKYGMEALDELNQTIESIQKRKVENGREQDKERLVIKRFGGAIIGSILSLYRKQPNAYDSFGAEVVRDVKKLDRLVHKNWSEENFKNSKQQKSVTRVMSEYMFDYDRLLELGTIMSTDLLVGEENVSKKLALDNNLERFADALRNLREACII